MRIVVVGRRRSLWGLTLTNLLTLGIRRRVWLVKVNKEMDAHAQLLLNIPLHIVLAILPIVGPFVLSRWTASRIAEIYRPLGEDSPKHGSMAWSWLLCFVPFLGTTAHMGIAQDRLNRYWPISEEKGLGAVDLSLRNPSDGYDQRLEVALEKSRKAGSRESTGLDKRKEQLERKREEFQVIQKERRRVRDLGGSTPVLPWKRPTLEPARHLRITCGRCELKFEQDQDPYADTPVVCPRCGLEEVMPGFASDRIDRKEHVATPAVKVSCPDCKTDFHAVRNLVGPTALRCYECGREDVLPAPQPLA